MQGQIFYAVSDRNQILVPFPVKETNYNTALPRGIIYPAQFETTVGRSVQSSNSLSDQGAIQMSTGAPIISGVLPNVYRGLYYQDSQLPFDMRDTPVAVESNYELDLRQQVYYDGSPLSAGLAESYAVQRKIQLQEISLMKEYNQRAGELLEREADASQAQLARDRIAQDRARFERSRGMGDIPVFPRGVRSQYVQSLIRTREAISSAQVQRNILLNLINIIGDANPGRLFQLQTQLAVHNRNIEAQERYYNNLREIFDGHADVDGPPERPPRNEQVPQFGQAPPAEEEKVPEEPEMKGEEPDEEEKKEDVFKITPQLLTKAESFQRIFGVKVPDDRLEEFKNLTANAKFPKASRGLTGDLDTGNAKYRQLKDSQRFKDFIASL